MNTPEEPAKQTPGRRPRWITAARMALAAAAAPPAAFFTWTYTESLPTAMAVLTLGFALTLYVWYQAQKPTDPPKPPEETPALPPPRDGEP